MVEKLPPLRVYRQSDLESQQTAVPSQRHRRWQPNATFQADAAQFPGIRGDVDAADVARRSRRTIITGRDLADDDLPNLPTPGRDFIVSNPITMLNYSQYIPLTGPSTGPNPGHKVLDKNPGRRRLFFVLQPGAGGSVAYSWGSNNFPFELQIPLVAGTPVNENMTNIPMDELWIYSAGSTAAIILYEGIDAP